MKVQYKWNSLLFTAIVVLMISTGIIYYFFYDILIATGAGSLRSAVGTYFFMLPIVVLLLVQFLIISGITHMITIIRTNARRDYLKACGIASLMVFMFSLTYAIFPAIGPFNYMIFPVTSGPVVLIAEILMTIITITAGALCLRKGYGLSWKFSFLTAAFLLALIMCIAS